MGVSFMTTFHFAFDDLTAFKKSLYCLVPSIVRFGLLIVLRQACETGCESDGTSAANALRTFCGAVGARSGWLVDGLLQTPFADAFALRNERSSRKKIWRFLPQRSVR